MKLSPQFTLLGHENVYKKFLQTSLGKNSVQDCKAAEIVKIVSSPFLLPIYACHIARFLLG